MILAGLPGCLGSEPRLRVMGEVSQVVHALVLMTHHEHLFVETPQPDLSMGMRQHIEPA